MSERIPQPSPLPEEAIFVEKDHFQEEDYLKKVDRIVLRAGLEKIDGFLENLSAEELPDLFIFPDITARPLAYAVKPIAHAAYERKGIATPPFLFIPTFSKEILMEMQPGSEKRDRAKEIHIQNEKDIFDNPARKMQPVSEEEFREDNLELRKRNPNVPLHTYQEYLEKFRETEIWYAEAKEESLAEGEKLPLSWEALQSRIQQMQKMHAPVRILVIDDFIQNGITFSILEQAFQRWLPTTQLRFMAMYNKSSQTRLGNEEDRFIVGATPKTPGLERYGGFAYRGVFSAAVLPSGLEILGKKAIKETKIGLTKSPGEPFAKPSPYAMKPSMKHLRELMRAEGEKALHDLHPETKPITL